MPLPLKQILNSKPDMLWNSILEMLKIFLASKTERNINFLLKELTAERMKDLKFRRFDIVKVADEFWDFLGGKTTYKDLLDCFERVGIELRYEIDAYFTRFDKR